MSQFFPGPGPLQDEFESTKAEIIALNDNIEKVQNGLAYIVGDTNTTGGTLAAGQFVYVKGHATIPEGLRKVTASISADGAITTNNTEACTEGGLNALNSDLGNKLTYLHENTDTLQSIADSIKLGIYQAEGYCTINIGNSVAIQFNVNQQNKLYARTLIFGTWSEWKEL